MQVCRRPATFDFDEEYLRRLQNEDRPTGQHFASHFSRFLSWRLRARYRDTDLIEDMQQETLRRVLEAIRRGALRDPHRLESFANAVCSHVLREHWRSTRKHAHAEADLDALVSPSNPERSYRRIEAVRRVRSAMDSLASRDREVLSIVFMEDQGLLEVSVRLRVSRDYARVLVHRALGRLRELC